ncbi:ABC transporter permease [Aminobacter sp. MSH1]|uniref:ABC transporter permease n=1 Tax=Aminobacter sp. MSH1 TaxID=374606 RepID=UPI00131ED67C|nr:ABC transporter permease [Aminobacter sp. MSH1]
MAPILAPYDPVAANATSFLQPPNAMHWLGTDAVGMDILSRVLYAPRIDVAIALGGTAASVLIGTSLGLWVGYYAAAGGIREILSFGIMRVADVMQAFPVFVFAIALVASLGQSIQTLLVAIAFVNAPIYLRLMRNQALAARRLRYVEAATVAGLSPVRIMLRHILPNSAGPLLAQASVNIGWAVLLTASLSFVGAGVRPPTPELGSMIAAGFQNVVTGQWWPSLVPGIALAAIVLGFSLVGESLEVLTDPVKVRELVHDVNLHKAARTKP